MRVELRLGGEAHRVVNVVFDGYEVTCDGGETVVVGDARDEADALALIDRARNVGFTVRGWRMLGDPRGVL